MSRFARVKQYVTGNEEASEVDFLPDGDMTDAFEVLNGIWKQNDEDGSEPGVSEAEALGLTQSGLRKRVIEIWGEQAAKEMDCFASDMTTQAQSSYGFRRWTIGPLLCASLVLAAVAITAFATLGAINSGNFGGVSGGLEAEVVDTETQSKQSSLPALDLEAVAPSVSAIGVAPSAERLNVFSVLASLPRRLLDLNLEVLSKTADVSETQFDLVSNNLSEAKLVLQGEGYLGAYSSQSNGSAYSFLKFEDSSADAVSSSNAVFRFARDPSVGIGVKSNGFVKHSSDGHIVRYVYVLSLSDAAPSLWEAADAIGMSSNIAVSMVDALREVPGLDATRMMNGDTVVGITEQEIGDKPKTTEIVYVRADSGLVDQAISCAANPVSMKLWLRGSGIDHDPTCSVLSKHTAFFEGH